MRKNVAGQTIGAQLISKTDGSPVTSGTTDVYITGDGGTQSLSGVSPSGAVHEGNGYWSYPPSQADTNYDHIAFTFVNSSAINVTVQVFTSYPQTGDNYARIGAAVGSPSAQTLSDDMADIKSKVDSYLDAAISSRLASASYTAPDNATIALAYARIGAAVGSPSAQTISDDLLDIKLKVDSNLDATVSSRLATSGYTAPLDAAGTRSAVGLASANLDTQLSAINSKTTNLPSDPADASDIAAAFSTVNSTLSTLATSASLASVSAVTDLLNGMIEVGSGSPTYYRYKVTALEQAPTGGSAPSAATIADAVWDEARSGHVSAGSFGEGVASVTGSVGSVATGGIVAGSFGANALDAVWSTATRLLTAGTNIVLAKGVGVTGFNDLDAAGIRSAVGLASANLDTQIGTLATAANLATVAGYLDTEIAAILSNTNTSLTTTNLLQSMLEVGSGSPTYYRYKANAVELAPSGGGTAPTAAEVADAVWDEAIASHLSAGSTGEALSDAGAAGNPWNNTAEGSYTFGDLVRIMAGVMAGKFTITVNSDGSATIVFRDVTDSSNIVTAQMSSTKPTVRHQMTLAP